jgi:hypothetical protein
MVWVKLDDSYFEHPKVASAGEAAAVANLRAICWSSRFLTDGFLPDAVAHQLAGSQPQETVAALVRPYHGRPGLWVHLEAQNGYAIHDFLDYNPSKEQVESERRAARERQSRRRSESGKFAGSHGVTESAGSSPEHLPKGQIQAESRRDNVRTSTKVTAPPDTADTAVPVSLSGGGGGGGNGTGAETRVAAISTWAKVKTALAKDLDPKLYRDWFTVPVATRLVDGVLWLKVPNETFAEFIPRKFGEAIVAAAPGVITKMGFEVRA